MTLVLILILGAQLSAPPLEEILQRYESALGDPAVWQSHESRIVRMRYEEITGTGGDVHEYSLAPNRYVHLMLLDAGPSMRMGSDGKTVWNDTPRGPEVVPAEKVPTVARDAVFNRQVRLRELYPQMRLVGAAAVGGRPAWHVEATAPEGEKEQLYFDAATGLLLRRIHAYVLPDGMRIPRDAVYEEYAVFGGVRMPSRIRQFAPAAAILTVESVEHNADIMEFIFAPPQCGGRP